MDRFQIGDTVRFIQDDREGIGIIKGIEPHFGDMYAVAVISSVRNGIENETSSLHDCGGFFNGHKIGWNVYPDNILEVVQAATPMVDIDMDILMEVLSCG